LNFRKILQVGSKIIEESTVGEVKQYFDDKNFKKREVINIFVDLTNEDGLFN